MRVLLSLLSGLPLSKVHFLSNGGTKWAFALMQDKGKRVVVRYWMQGFQNQVLNYRVDADRLIKTEAEAANIVGPMLGVICQDIPALPMDVSEYVVTEWKSHELVTNLELPDWQERVDRAKSSNPVLMSRGDDWGFALRKIGGEYHLMPVTIDFSHLNYIPQITDMLGASLAPLSRTAQPAPIPLNVAPTRLQAHILTAHGLA